MTRITIAVASGICAVFGLAAAPDGERSVPALLSFGELENRLGDPDLRLLDARTKAEYEKAHIPGAVWADASAAAKIAARPDGLNNKAAWEAWIKPLGIKPTSRVVICDGERQLSAARLWWLLSYLGVERVGLINGNFALWQEENHKTTTEKVKVESSTFHVAFQADRRATRSEVLGTLKDKKAKIVDARSLGEHTGAQTKAKKGGHIPTACHLEWLGLVDANGRFKKPEEVREMILSRGIKPGDEIITHCQGGGRASVDAFALERLGYKTKNYYHGWSDWGNAEETPVEKGKD